MGFHLPSTALLIPATAYQNRATAHTAALSLRKISSSPVE